MGLMTHERDVSRRKQADPRCQRPDGDAHPVSRAAARALRGQIGGHDRQRTVPVDLPPAGLGGDRAQVDAPVEHERALSAPAAIDGRPCDGYRSGRTWALAAATEPARIRAANARRDADWTVPALRIMG